MPTRYDESRSGILVVQAIGHASDEDVEERILWLSDRLSRRPYVVVFDSSKSEPLTAPQRQRYADWLNQHRLTGRKNGVALALVVTSPIMRGIFTGIFWLWKPPMPYAFHASLGEALSWARLHTPAG